jgi:hypothetical protein
MLDFFDDGCGCHKRIIAEYGIWARPQSGDMGEP